jgi:arsenate reductase
MPDRKFNVLFLCTGNSARSILAEVILNQRGSEHFRGFSAGSQPTGRVNPGAIAELKRHGYPTQGLHSKNWEVFTDPQAPKIDFIFTVCDNAAGEVCPIWPGQPMTAHWGIPDPAAVESPPEAKAAAFAKAFQQLAERIDDFTQLPLAELDQMSLQQRLEEIGQRTSETA